MRTFRRRSDQAARDDGEQAAPAAERPVGAALQRYGNQAAAEQLGLARAPAQPESDAGSADAALGDGGIAPAGPPPPPAPPTAPAPPPEVAAEPQPPSDANVPAVGAPAVPESEDDLSAWDAWFSSLFTQIDSVLDARVQRAEGEAAVAREEVDASAASLRSVFTSEAASITAGLAAVRGEVQQRLDGALQGTLSDLGDSIGASRGHVDELHSSTGASLDEELADAQSAVDTAVDATSDRLDADGQSGGEALRSQADAEVAAVAGTETEAAVRDAVSGAATEAAGDLRGGSSAASDDLVRVGHQVTEPWSSAVSDGHEQLSTSRDGAFESLDELEAGVGTELSEQVSGASTALETWTTDLESTTTEVSAASAATVDDQASSARQAIDEGLEAHRSKLIELGDTARAKLEGARDEGRQELATAEGDGTGAGIVWGLAEADDPLAEWCAEVADADERLVAEYGHQAAEFSARAEAGGEAAVAGGEAALCAAEKEAEGQIEHVETGIGDLLSQSNVALEAFGGEVEASMFGTRDALATGFGEGIAALSEELVEASNARGVLHDDAVDQGLSAVHDAAANVSKSFFEKGLASLGAVIGGAWWSGFKSLVGSLGNWAWETIANLGWGIIWGDPWFDQGWWGNIVAFAGDVVAGAFIWGDVRDLIRYIFVEDWHWTNLIVIVFAIVGIAASIFATPLGGGIVAFVKGIIKALLKGGIKSLFKGAFKGVLKNIPEALAEKLVKELGEEAAEQLVRELGAELVEKLARELSAEAIRELHAKLGKDLLERMVEKGFGGSAIQDLAGKASKDTLEVLVRDLSKEGIERVVANVPRDTLERLTREGMSGPDLLRFVDHPAGARPDAFRNIRGKGDVPEHYRNDSRFDALSSDPDHAGKQHPGSLREAMVGLEAESLGKLQQPIRRGPEGIEFYDARGTPIDVKAPPSPRQGAPWRFDIQQNVDSVREQLNVTFPNGNTNRAEPVHVLLDTTYMTADDFAAFRQALMEQLSAEQLSRVIMANSRL